MDAYSSYILKLTEDRLRDLRREAAEYGMSRAARKARRPIWATLGDRFGRRPRPSVVPMPQPAPFVELDAGATLRRSA